MASTWEQHVKVKCVDENYDFGDRVELEAIHSLSEEKTTTI